MGLANPGSQFVGSRHNVGGDAVTEVIRRAHSSLSVERRQRCSLRTLELPVGIVTFAIPTTFMNESGAALPGLLRRCSLSDFRNLVIAHDELDLEPGRLQLKFGGGLAGNNGLRSIASVLGTTEFARLRIGIGKPLNRNHGAEWVTKPPTGANKIELDVTVQQAADALELLGEFGFDVAQQRVNGTAT